MLQSMTSFLMNPCKMFYAENKNVNENVNGTYVAENISRAKFFQVSNFFHEPISLVK